jgi:hypothetical protein
VDLCCREEDFTQSVLSPTKIPPSDLPCKRGLQFADDIGKMIPSSGNEVVPSSDEEDREPTPLELPAPAIAPKRKRARRERKSLLEYGKSTIFKTPTDAKRVSKKPKRLGHQTYCVKCRKAFASDDE